LHHLSPSSAPELNGCGPDLPSPSGRDRSLFAWRNAMRSVLVFGLLIAVSAGAQAATHHHYTDHHIFISPRAASSLNAVSGWADEPLRPAIRFNGVPSYNDPSKYGGEAALPVQ
jgi:hypothetical protein